MKQRTSSCRFVYVEGPPRLYEGAKLLVESRGHGELIAFDPRVRGPGGIRVGHTGGDLERLLPDYTEIKCIKHDATTTMCLLESARDHEIDCDNTGVGGIRVFFGSAPDPNLPCCRWAPVGASARDAFRNRKVVAIQVRHPECT